MARRLALEQLPGDGRRGAGTAVSGDRPIAAGVRGRSGRGARRLPPVRCRRNRVLAAAYRSGAYSMQSIAEHFGISRMTVSRAVKNSE